ncbi:MULTISPECIES: chromate resistance protein ChrB domain-containing protein [unclassified Paenibacillus]|uniref:chromate resistance protein ChrB domain-containing protein n=1 Tax=unclassified Paenibacillus TaxID=185978 RepID=UPI001AE870BA|nr:MULTISPECIES: chromate resistance protein ChrB domain-containing protein [unclassified Paenibacillus]MBP1154217.1 hypothetical protein [Paenibacillus sp. PvP091]MBP1170398.1 hypothetical protein [Paenibacillus sp. PvR098]MBP2441426.1 hypothetical protein [Paenibacillus sp. PvP052]
MKWVTWQNVGVDRMACAWLIKHFIDPEATFIFVPVGEKNIPGDAEPFDIPGAKYSHYRGHCSFHTLLREFQLTDPILHRIARIVDEADTVQEIMLEPSAPGLDLICRGIRLVSQDDIAALEYGFILYQGIYEQLTVESKN